MNADKKNPDYTQSEEYKNNLEKQQECFDAFQHELNHRDSPFSNWHDFMWNYNHFRACVMSLRNNPDTNNDEDFNELCRIWESGELFHFTAHGFDELEHRYRTLKEKPCFEKNPLYNELFGCFVKGPYQLLTRDPYYWEDFFKLD